MVNFNSKQMQLQSQHKKQENVYSDTQSKSTTFTLLEKERTREFLEKSFNVNDGSVVREGDPVQQIHNIQLIEDQNSVASSLTQCTSNSITQLSIDPPSQEQDNNSGDSSGISFNSLKTADI